MNEYDWDLAVWSWALNLTMTVHLFFRLCDNNSDLGE